MELHLTIKLEVRDAKLARLIRKAFLGESSGLSESPLSALEDIPNAEQAKVTQGQFVEADWVISSNVESLLECIVDALGAVGLQKMVAYYWADEAEGFIYCVSDQLVEDRYWRENIDALELDASDEESISKYLSNMLERMDLGNDE